MKKTVKWLALVLCTAVLLGCFGICAAAEEEGGITLIVDEEVLQDAVKILEELKKQQEAALFTDVPLGSWYYDSVNYVAMMGLMNGTGDRKFSPDAFLTRAMLVTVLYRMAGSPEISSANVFTDVPEGMWYTSAVIWGYENGIVKGTSATTFAPDNNITRQDMTVMLCRFADAMGIALPVSAQEQAQFPDDAQIASYAKDSVYRMRSAGIISGRSVNGSVVFAPLGTASRAEIAKVIASLHAMMQ